MKPRTRCVAILLGVIVAASAHAQNWPLPASTPNTPVKCSASCPGTLAGQLTSGWNDPVVGFVGRFVDSAYMQDYQQTFRTARAGLMLTNPARTRIYFQLGNAVAAYDASTFFTRLEAHEPLMSATSVPVNPPNVGTHPPPFENFLRFDSFFYAENGSGWNCPPGDGQDRLFEYDVDDRNVVYMAYSKFGWGTAKDEGNGGGLMQPNYQEPTGFDLSPKSVFWVKSSSGSYFAFLGNGGNGPSTIYNVDDYMHPVLRGVQSGFSGHARGNNRMGLIDPAGEVLIYDNDALIGGGSPMVKQLPSATGAYTSISFDGTNFWAGGVVAGSGIVSKFAPNGNSSVYNRTDYTVSAAGTQFLVQSVRCRDGYLGLAGFTTSGIDQRLYKISSGAPVEIPLNGNFFHYYSAPPSGMVKAPRSQPSIVEPWVRNGKLYIVIPAVGLGDVWQLRSDDGMSVALQGTVGGVNPNAPARNSGDVFYGDNISFVATASSGASKGVQWNFGSPVSDPTNTAQGTTGTAVYHQYSGLTPQQIATPLNVTATDSATGTAGTYALTMKTPTVRFGFGNAGSTYKYLFTQANASSPAPIVADDTFFDASDGDLSGHFNEWRIGPDAATINSPSFIPQYATPSTRVAVGTCGQHTLSLTGHYGKYTVMAPGTPDFGVTLTPFSYTVQPFAASVDYASDSANNQLVFTSISRSAAVIASSAVTYAWDIETQTGTLVYPPAGPVQGSAASLASIPSFTVPLSTFTTAGLRARLTVGMADVSAVCAGAPTSQTAYSAALPTLPDAVLSVSSCNSTGCSYSVTSPSGALTRDGWTFSWAALDANGNQLGSDKVTPTSSNGSTYAPVFFKIGTYKVRVTVTNAIGSVTRTSDPYTTTANASTCANMVPDSNVFIDGSGSNCRTSSGTCSSSDAVTFVVTFWNGYNQTCATHTYSWLVDGVNAGTGQTIVKTFSQGNHSVSCTINNGSQSVTVQQTFTIRSSAPPPPPPPPPTNCATLVPNSNVFMTFSGSASGCSDRGGTCSASESISFGINFWAGYNQTCASHSYSWRFDDGATAAGQAVSKSFTAGTHIVTCTVSNGSQSVDVSATVTVSGTPPPPPPPVGNQCGTLTANQNVFLSYVGPVSHCHDSGNCSSGEAIAFSVNYWQFTPSTAASCTPSYSWQFDDGGTGTGQSIAHTFNTTGQHTATCTVTYGSQTLALTATLNVVGNPAIPAPEVTVAVEALGGNTYKFTPLVKSGTVTKFVWDFGDGTGATTTDAKPVTNTYLKPGKYTVTLEAKSNGPSAIVTSIVTVGTSRPRAVRH